MTNHFENHSPENIEYIQELTKEEEERLFNHHLPLMLFRQLCLQYPESVQKALNAKIEEPDDGLEAVLDECRQELEKQDPGLKARLEAIEARNIDTTQST